MPKTRLSPLKHGFTLVLTLFLVGCSALGPQGVRQGRNNYNHAIVETNAQQFLLNIVRVRYNDTPFVLDISSISSRLEFEGELGAEVSNGRNGDSIGTGASYSEKPTIIYQPLRGKDFVRQLMTPVDLQTLILLRQSGWEIDDILRVFANEINGVPNAPTGADSTPEGVPKYKRFLRASEALDTIEDSGDLILAASGSGTDKLLLEVRPGMRDSEAFAQFCDILGLDPNASRYEVTLGIGAGGGNRIVIETRPILSAMFFIGQGIQIPAEHSANGYVHQSLDDDGVPFDWSKVHNSLILIKSSAEEPEVAAVKVKYLDYWFYVDLADVESRETLTMLSVVFTLQAGGSATRDAPVLTIPVN